MFDDWVLLLFRQIKLSSVLLSFDVHLQGMSDERVCVFGGCMLGRGAVSLPDAEGRRESGRALLFVSYMLRKQEVSVLVAQT